MSAVVAAAAGAARCSFAAAHRCLRHFAANGLFIGVEAPVLVLKHVREEGSMNTWKQNETKEHGISAPLMQPLMQPLLNLIDLLWAANGRNQQFNFHYIFVIRKLGACPKQAFLPSTLSGEVFYFMLLLDSLEFAGRYCLGKTAFVEFTWQPHFQQLLLQLPLLHLPSEQPDTPCTSSIHMASNVRPANAATICSYHQSPHQTWPDILG